MMAASHLYTSVSLGTSHFAAGHEHPVQRKSSDFGDDPMANCKNITSGWLMYFYNFRFQLIDGRVLIVHKICF